MGAECSLPNSWSSRCWRAASLSIGATGMDVVAVAEDPASSAWVEVDIKSSKVTEAANRMVAILAQIAPKQNKPRRT